MQFLWLYLDDLVGKGLEISIISELMLYASAHLVPLALPLSMLLASIMTFGNLGENNELLAMKAAGISLIRFMQSLIYLSILISAFALYFSIEVLPVANKKFGALLWSVRTQRPELIIKEGIFSNEIDGFSIKVDRKSKVDDTLYDIMIYDHRANKGNTNIIVADSGSMKISDDKKYMIMTLYSGERYSEVVPKDKRKKTDYPFRKEKFGKEVMVTSLRGMDFKRKDESAFKNNYRMMPLPQLINNIDSITTSISKKREGHSIRMKYITPLTRKLLTFANDSLKVPKIEMKNSLNIDSLMGTFDLAGKQKVISTALKNARTNKRSIQQAKDDIIVNSRWLNKYRNEWHRKYTLSIACLIFFFIGAPLGAIIRKGGLGMPLVISVFLFIFYYIASMIGERVAREGGVTVWSGMWFSTLLFLPAGIFLTYKAANDSVILNITSYFDFFRKIKTWLSQLKKELSRIFP
jgi:lipopolysaccharide export system permease protein